MDNSTAFQLYCKYSNAAREEADQHMTDALSENEFVLVWQSLSTTQRSRWESRFEAGFKNVILSESLQYASVLSSGKLRIVKAA